MTKTKTIFIMGPTASGKTAVAVRLAQTIQGEIVSADSRQVYRELDIGSGKDLRDYGTVPYHLINVVEAGSEFSVSDFQKLARTALTTICDKNKIPIICGGTGHYIKALLEDYRFEHAPSSPELTRHLESLPIEALYQQLKTWGIWNDRNWETDSKRRIARAIEKVMNPPKKTVHLPPFSACYDYLIFFMQFERSLLNTRIRLRLIQRLEEGMIEETERLLQRGITHQRLERYGLEYRYISRFLRGLIQKEELVKQLQAEISRFAKRQMTFIRYMQRCGHEMIPVSSFNELWARTRSWLELQ